MNEQAAAQNSRNKGAGPGEAHELIVDRLCATDGVKRNGFARAVLSKLTAMCNERDAKDSLGWRRNGSIGIVPDAWAFEDAKREGAIWDSLIAYEAVVTHDIPDHKVKRYAHLWFSLDCEMIDLKLYRVGPGGEPEAVPLGDLWMHWVPYKDPRGWKEIVASLATKAKA